MTVNLPNLDLYPITDNSYGRTHLQLAKEIAQAGVEVIQFREKEKSMRECVSICQNLRKLTWSKRIALIINDRIDLSLAVDADGVHIGQDDMPLNIAREILGENKIIGVSVDNLTQAKKAEEKADYLGVGPIFSTSTKPNAGSPIGLQTLQRISTHVNIPIVAIGGITLQNVKKVINHGADGVAVISAIAQAPNPSKKTLKLKKKAKEAKDNQI